MYLLQAIHDVHEAHDAFDLSFNLMQVIIIGGGIISIVGLYYTLKNYIQRVRDKNEADQALMEQKVESLEKEIKSTKKDFEQLEKNIGNKLDGVSKSLNEMALGFANFKTEMTKFIYKSGKQND